ncbi:hypothetical protein [Phyllobacterium zundukense]|uniref:Uncharacterized protein n=1 Tax=Phyllobacterium zundukense TaxID=1867719 RepID=A0A2N9VX62_9HYPH|nr:hypothetical protein [Phyllobacterium zundukense]ATU90340.1 hypothetical protein BLM14_00650 [Phyllobacterium zundukense]PIO44080.1 hypothetical protein B5P45_16125 [Phyllobacterium zundukense]
MKRIYIDRIIVSGFAAALFAASVVAADAQIVICAPHAQIVEYLKDEFQELPGAYGLVGDKAILELFLAPEGVTWTIVLTDISGKSCILAAGDSWEQKPDTAGLKT